MLDNRLVIGVLSPYIGGHYSGSIFLGLQRAAQESHARLISIQGSIDIHNTFAQYDLGVHPLALDQVDGWIVEIRSDSVPTLLASGKPVVTISTVVDGGACPAVLPANHSSTYELTRHLIEQHGHRRLAFMGMVAQRDIRERYAGYQQALSELGIPLEEELVVEVEDNTESQGAWGARQLLARGRPFTALVCGTDLNAIGAMKALQEAGSRIPEDIAVVGFDDNPDAQYASPPLTTVRMDPRQLGEAAIPLLLAQLRGEAVPPITRTLTSLMLRHSCGCTITSLLERLKTESPVAETSWQARSASQLVTLLCYPAAPGDPEQTWPGVATLIQGIEAAAAGEELPSVQLLEQAWAEALLVSQDNNNFAALLSLLQHVSLEHLAAGEGARARMEQLIGRVVLALLNAQHKPANHALSFLENQFSLTYDVNLAMLSEPREQFPALSWLRHIPISWACLGLWASQPTTAETRLVVAGSYCRGREPVVPVGSSYAPPAFPPLEAYAAAGVLHEGDTITTFPLVTETRDWGVLVLADQRGSRLDQGHDVIMMMSTLSAVLERNVLLAALSSAKEEADAARRVAEEANQFKSRFIANMSHELRTPLNSIINYTDFIGDEDLGGSLNARQHGLRERIGASAEHLLGLINDILDLSEIETGALELYRAELDLRAVFEAVLASAADLGKEKGLGLSLILPDEPLPPVQADQLKLQQVLLNLLSNAFKFTEQGGVTIRVELPGDGYVRVAVQDTGIGIAPEQQALVFDEFRQLDPDANRLYEGTGLGLAISKKFIELHGGRIWLESTPGHGSTFYFTLPMA